MGKPTVEVDLAMLVRLESLIASAVFKSQISTEAAKNAQKWAVEACDSAESAKQRSNGNSFVAAHSAYSNSRIAVIQSDYAMNTAKETMRKLDEAFAELNELRDSAV